MALPDPVAAQNLGDPNTGTNYITYTQRNRLEHGFQCHYIDPNTLTHTPAHIEQVLNASGLISVAFDDGSGRRQEIMPVAYDGTASIAGSWHFKSDG